MVKHGWSQNVYDEIISKLDYCANALMPWGNQVCACFEKDIQRCKQKLEELRYLSNQHSIREFMCLRDELNCLFAQEEAYWRQHARVFWIRDGDTNSKLFMLLQMQGKKKGILLQS